MKTKRVTIAINTDVDEIIARLTRDTGIKMSYVQVFNYLIHFYLKHSAEPKTAWRAGIIKD